LFLGGGGKSTAVFDKNRPSVLRAKQPGTGLRGGGGGGRNAALRNSAGGGRGGGGRFNPVTKTVKAPGGGEGPRKKI